MTNLFLTSWGYKDIPVEDWHDAYLELSKKNDELEKALNKACKKLHWYDKRLGDENKTWTEQEWKKWLLSNE